MLFFRNGIMVWFLETRLTWSVSGSNLRVSPVLCTGLGGPWSCEWVAAYGKLSSTPFQPHCWNSDSIRTELAHWGDEVGMGAVESLQHGEGVEEVGKSVRTLSAVLAGVGSQSNAIYFMELCSSGNFVCCNQYLWVYASPEKSLFAFVPNYN